MVKVAVISILCFISTRLLAQGDVSLGAYYFDGWTGTYPYHITDKLRSFKERESKWGWETSSQKILDIQIKSAASSGLSFFSFCWYNNLHKGKEPLNNALGYYLKSAFKNSLKFNLLIANHGGFEIGPNEWDALTSMWVQYFNTKTYLKVDNKPLITFFSLSTLIKKFGTADKVKQALQVLRAKAIKTGLKDVNIGICVGPNIDMITQAEECGFDILTGYNYHSLGFHPGDSKVVLIQNMIEEERKAWTYLSVKSQKKVIPVCTLNWDPRPWVAEEKWDKTQYYVGFSPLSVRQSVQSCLSWLKEYYSNQAGDKVAVLYAWNEYGEGAYLTPTRMGVDYLKGIKSVIKNN
jgi:hypothetical protein